MTVPNLEISCGFAPGPHTPEQVRLAEDLGYERAWFFDSPALYQDIWVTMALAAERTERITLGTAVLVPGLRHPLTQASAIATLESLAPGRIVVAIGTGFTGREALGQKAMPWADTRTYIAQVKGLLEGEAMVIDGALVKMIPPAGFLPDRPMKVPIVVAANGPKGFAVAKELGDGVMTVIGGNPDFDWSSQLTFGTVLDPGESADSERVYAQVSARCPIAIRPVKPVPIAATVRPGARSSSVAIALAWVSGWRRFGTSTAGPSPIRSVRNAASAAITQMSG